MEIEKYLTLLTAVFANVKACSQTEVFSLFKDSIVHKKDMKYFHEDVKGQQDGH